MAAGLGRSGGGGGRPAGARAYLLRRAARRPPPAAAGGRARRAPRALIGRRGRLRRRAPAAAARSLAEARRRRRGPSGALKGRQPPRRCRARLCQHPPREEGVDTAPGLKTTPRPAGQAERTEHTQKPFKRKCGGRAQPPLSVRTGPRGRSGLRPRPCGGNRSPAVPE